MRLRIEVLGPLRVRDGREIRLQRSSHRRLLSILALDANRRLGTDLLIDRFWGDEVPPTAKAALQTHVSALRKLIPDGIIVTEGYGYRLDLAGHAFDAEELVTRAAAARQAVRTRRWDEALVSAAAALGLWRGMPYEELRDDAFARAEIARLEELRLEVEELRAEALLGVGHDREALSELERLVSEHPLRERLWEHLMTARYRLGRHADALEAYREAWKAFAELGLEPSASLRSLEQKILLHDENVRRTETPHNLPVELTRFIGRERELGEIGALLADHRLVTLTGAGGSGKTRLAVEVAGGALELYPDGCWLVELGPVGDADLVPLEVAETLGLRAPGDEVVETLAAVLGRDDTLLVLDNCEHVLDGAAALARALLEAGHDLTILATSRQPLRVPGEVVYEVPPMAFPADESADVGDLRAFDAVELFAERAGLARPSFVLDQANAAAVARVCRRLDGIPLAIELAASRVGALSPQAIADRLDDRFRILTGGSSTEPARHQTLEAAFAWSFALLDAREQAVFARLGVFRGGFTLEMAEEICSGDGIDSSDVVPVVSDLVEKSLVSVYEPETKVRYRLLETVREYAWTRLRELGDPDTVRSRHLDWCLRFAHDVVARVYGAGRWELFERLDEERDNLQAALEWATALGLAEVTGALERALAWHAWDHGQLQRAIASLRAALARCSDVRAEAEIRTLLGAALSSAGETDAAFEETARAFELVAPLAPSPAKAWVLERHVSLQVLLVDRPPEPAVALGRAAVEEAEKTGDAVAVVRTRRALGRALVWNGELDEGLAEYRTALRLAREHGDPATTLDTYELMYDLLYLHPTARRAEPRRITEEIVSRFGDRWTTHAYRSWIPYVFIQSGEWRRAEELLERLETRHLEGFDRSGHLITRATLRWMQGRLEDAWTDVEELRGFRVNPRWYHDYFPLVVDLAADRGRLDEARAAAEEYVAISVDRSEQAKKLGVLAPLARAEVDAASPASDRAREENVEQARAAVGRARDILVAFPPPTSGSLQMETPSTYLALAEAEVSRLRGSDPMLWQDVAERCDYSYFRLYAQFRLAEALLATGRDEEGTHELRAAHADATRVGAERIRRRLEQLAAEAGVELTRSRAPSRS